MVFPMCGGLLFRIVEKEHIFLFLSQWFFQESV